MVFLLLVGCASVTSPKNRKSANIHYDLGVVEMKNNHMRQSLRELLIALDLDPRHAMAHNAIALVYHQLEKKEEALSHYRQAVRLKENFSEAQNNLGTLLTDLGQYDEAVDMFKAALANILYVTPAHAEGNMGWTYYKKGDRDKALMHLRNAVATNPKFCRGYEWLARIGLDSQDSDAVVIQCHKFEKFCIEGEEMADFVPKAYVQRMKYYRGLAHLQQGDLQSAATAFEQCAQVMEDGLTAKCREALEGSAAPSDGEG
jgi:type IV pilus assembly protein PilF